VLRKCPDCFNQVSDQATECPHCGRPRRLSTTSQITDFLKAVPITIGVVTLAFGVLQYVKAQDWHRAEFVAEEMRQFESKLEVREAMKMIRWDGRHVNLPEREPGKVTRRISNEDLRAALQPESSSGATPFAEDHAQIRDYFDVFFSGLERFDHFIRAGLVVKGDLEPYLDQWITALGDTGRAKQQILRKYVHCSRYSGIEHLIQLWGLKSPTSIPCTDNADDGSRLNDNAKRQSRIEPRSAAKSHPSLSHT
jgi:hypothetical protein